MAGTAPSPSSSALHRYDCRSIDTHTNQPHYPNHNEMKMRERLQRALDIFARKIRTAFGLAMMVQTKE